MKRKPLIALSTQEKRLSENIMQQGSWMSRLKSKLNRKKTMDEMVAVMIKNGVFARFDQLSMDTRGMDRQNRARNAAKTLALMVNAKDVKPIEDLLHQNMKRLDKEAMIAKVVDRLEWSVRNNMENYHKMKIGHLESEKAASKLLNKTGLLKNLEDEAIQNGEDLAKILNESGVRIDLKKKHQITDAVFGPNSKQWEAVKTDHLQKARLNQPA